MVDKPSGRGGARRQRHFTASSSSCASPAGLRFLELVHRLDRDTSGVLMLAKKRSALTGLHAQLREGTVRKHYLGAGAGRMEGRKAQCASWRCTSTSPRPASAGWSSTTEGSRRTRYSAWCRICPATACSMPNSRPAARTRSACIWRTSAFPIAGDDKYGDFDANKRLAKTGLKRMFLHAASLEFRHPRSERVGTRRSAARTGTAAFPATRWESRVPGR